MRAVRVDPDVPHPTSARLLTSLTERNAMKTCNTIATIALAAATIGSPAFAQEAGSTGHSRITTIAPQNDKGERGGGTTGNRADFNHSGTVDIQDIFDYLTAFLANKPEADMNGNGILDGLDVLTFINIWLMSPNASVSSAG
jgi:hypothetical protein